MNSIQEVAGALFNALSSDSRAFRLALKKFYQHSEPQQYVRNFILKNGGRKEEIGDHYHEVFMEFERKLREKKVDSSKDAYLYFKGIVRFMWWDKIRKKNPLLPIEAIVGKIDFMDPESLLLLKDRRQTLDKIISNLNERCQKLLSLFRLGFSYQEISEAVPMEKDQVRKAFFKCNKKIETILAQRPDWRDSLKYKLG